MQYKVIAVLCFLLLNLSACELHHHHEHASDQQGVDFLTLNSAEKWQMDEHTRGVFQRMSHRLTTQNVKTLSAAERQALAGHLKQDIDDLIQGCTMQGAAHNALHQYLVTYMDAVNQLAKHNDLAGVERVKQLLADYPRYFE